MEEAVINVVGMSSENCRASVEGALISLAGVKDAAVSVDTGAVTISYQAEKVNPTTLRKTIIDQGYEVG